MLKQLKDNEQGVVFITVLMIIIVMMVLAISVISMNVSQVMLTEGEVRRIQAEQLAMGGIALMYGNQMANSGSSNLITFTETLGDTTFNVVINVGPATGPNNTNTLTSTVTQL